ncbi:SAV_2336 N-terminal domain-related protein [Streptacidiphilus sp. P02-A3a]|uniref:SAV_2336 N-terminal domain-related protein n=1 Tax=Streptacidiphilus sp. P02-A3a TaxID=2704468 RepID=UPI0015FCD5FA|nr:SAV_2336 N-terminal domain-related protein [Streptacidiphilus sp. P02-A3a]QMU71783.1 hypothetical protein GXP74_29635 [Streptacidiphilus sp. P02-A3a]
MPGEAGGSGRRALVDLVGVLRGHGVELDAEELSDALWLSQWLPGEPAGPAGAGGTADPAALDGHPGDDDRDLLDLVPRDSPSPHWSRPADRSLARPGRLASFGEVDVPSGAALPDPLTLQRALRPFQRYRPRVRSARTELDEQATADNCARTGLVLPVLHELPRREAELQLLMDASTAMAVWEPLLQGLREAFERVGAFRKVTIHYLTSEALGPDSQGRWVGASRHRLGPARRADELYDPTGRLISLVLSDGTGPLWRDGSLQRLLHRWSRHTPVALVQPLPQRLWGRTELRPQAGRLCRRPGDYQAPAFLPERPGSRPSGPADRLALPVLSPEPAALSAWAQLTSSAAGLSLQCAALWLPQDGRPDHPGPDAGPTGAGGSADWAPSSADDLLRRFERQASPAARRLAMYLSAAALTLPVILLVQRAMLPDSGTAELAEVLISDLLLPQAAPQAARPPGPPDQLWFDFASGVRDLLLDRLTTGEAALVLKHCSLYIERNFGRGARNLPAVAVSSLADTGREPVTGSGAVPEPFARVSEQVLRRFEPALALHDPARGGELLLERYRRDGSAGHLLQALQLLRAAGPSAGEALARGLDAAWRVWRDPAFLDEGVRTAREALSVWSAGSDSDWPTRRLDLSVLLAGLLAERAGLCHEGGALPGALPGVLADLLPAEDLWRACLEHAPLPSPQLAAAAVGHASALRLHYRAEQWQADRAGLAPGADTERPERLRLLVEAEEALRTLVTRWPPERLPAELQLTLGLVLSDRARELAEEWEATGAQECVLRAVDALESAVALLDAEEAAEPDHARALLALSDALMLRTRLLPTDDWALGRAEETLQRLLRLDGLDGLDGGGYARRDGETPQWRPEALRRLAQVDLLLWARETDPARLVHADSCLTQALALLPVDKPERVEVLAARGEVLLARVAAAEENPPGAGGTSASVVDEAVMSLREAVAETLDDAPELAERQLLFSRTLRARYRARHRRADLYEAQWALESAARCSADPALLSQIHLELADIDVELGSVTGTARLLELASTRYLRAASNALRAGLPLVAARANHRRGQVLERVAGREQALAAYRRAGALWQEAGATADPEAVATRQRLAVLGPQAGANPEG